MTAGADDAPADVFHIERDAGYEQQLREEEAFWDRPHFFSLDAFTSVDPYQNRRLTDDPETAWYETVHRYGNFRMGCTVGLGWIEHERRILELNPSLHLTFYDLSAESLAKRDRELGSRFPDRVATEQVDLNFAELPERAFDVVISSGTFHHLLNVEHAAYQINRSLVSDGYFFLLDYVSEPRFQFSHEKKRIFEAALAKTNDPFLKSWWVDWPLPDCSNYPTLSPFEAVRSEATLPTLDRYLVREQYRSGMMLLPLALFLKQRDTSEVPAPRPDLFKRIMRRLNPPPPERPPTLDDLVEALANELIPLDDVLCDAEIMPPWNAFAIYRKRGS